MEQLYHYEVSDEPEDLTVTGKPEPPPKKTRTRRAAGGRAKKTTKRPHDYTGKFAGLLALLAVLFAQACFDLLATTS